MSLPPNKYYFSPDIPGGYTKRPKADFEVFANEVVYLGEYFMPKSCSFHTFMGISRQ